ncbi:hypothetical protein PV05_03947 [Exophiala xenobiotica]|uniref:Uncharacterized protein n=1 Tax=Exophiala xenobiotica TaxID=348802 RepID=A0A0D2EV14_9EURO|nr:uncharacterized protein PV05_03947 [Exophiala xenobiotica]KIW59503.1 hypothetical protein PV05_03947 [Exophiala xenobiotica]
MEFAHDIPQSNSTLSTSSQPTELQVDFSWRKYQAIVTEKSKPAEPLYNIHCRAIRWPHLTFKSATTDEIVGTGTLNCVSINAKYEVHGQKGTLKALKRFHTKYTYLSHASSDDDKPVPMTWTSSCGLKKWDFVCVDQHQNPVAKLSVNIWAIRKLGGFEFMGPKADSRELREEIIVTGLTLFYLMFLRANNILSLVGAVFARPGPLEAPEGEKSPELKTQ